MGDDMTFSSDLQVVGKNETEDENRQHLFPIETYALAFPQMPPMKIKLLFIRTSK
jgi:hypothetical protein